MSDSPSKELLNKEASAGRPDKLIASVTVRLWETQSGNTYCDCDSSLDEFRIDPYDAAKIQFQLLVWFATVQQMIVRKIMCKVEGLETGPKAGQQVEGKPAAGFPTPWKSSPFRNLNGGEW